MTREDELNAARRRDLCAFDSQGHVRGDARVVVLVLEQLWKLFGPDIDRLRPARGVHEKMEAFIADRPTTAQLQKALIEILVALARAEQPTARPGGSQGQ